MVSLSMENPYQPSDDSEPIGLRKDFQWSPSEYPKVRLAHLHHERIIKDLGLLSLIVGFSMVLMSLAGVVCGLLILLGRLQWAGQLNEYPPILSPSERIFQGSLWLGFSLAGIALTFAVIQQGRYFLQLDPVGRNYAVPVFIVFGLLLVPITTAIAAYLWFVIFSEKANAVFSLAYREVLDHTPGMRHPSTNAVTWLFAIAIFILLTFTFIGVLFNSLKPPVL